MHEHYKLKERIEQLRSMDSSAFLALDNTVFGDWEEPSFSDEEDLANGTTPDSPNHPRINKRGEWRRKKVLFCAMGLEERYKQLLPNEKKAAAQERVAQRSSLSMSVEPDVAEDTPEPEAVVTNGGVREVREESQLSETPSIGRGFKVTLRVPPRPPAAESISETRKKRKGRKRGAITEEPEPEPEPEPVEEEPAELSANSPITPETQQQPPREETTEPIAVPASELFKDLQEASDEESLIVEPPVRADSRSSINRPESPSPPPLVESISTAPQRSNRHMNSHPMNGLRLKVHLSSRHRTASTVSDQDEYRPTISYPVSAERNRFDQESLASEPTSRKRARVSLNVTSHNQLRNTYGSTPSEDDEMSDGGPPAHVEHVIASVSNHKRGSRSSKPCILVAASHNEGMESARKTSRQIMAFGSKLPNFDTAYEYALPDFVYEGFTNVDG